MELLFGLLAGLATGATALGLIMRERAATAYQRGRGEGESERSALAASLDAARRNEQALGARLDDADDRLDAGARELRALGAQLAAREEQARQALALRDELAAQQQERARLEQTLTRLQVREQELTTLLAQERSRHEEKLALLGEAREALGNQFKALAGDILEEKSRRFTEQNQSNLDALLKPLSERIAGFGKLVQDTYDKDSLGRLSLEQELRRMQELNNRLNQDAVALTNALTGSNNKAQGTWGEMVLEKVLETSGLQRDREYRVQVSDVLDDGDATHRYQPDVVIDLPENKQLVVDSKVSLNAYVRYTAATDEATRDEALKQHVLAIRTHIRTLSEKRYQDLYRLNTLDFVFMFIPVEPAYLLAVQYDATLFEEAFARRIMVVGPGTLLATLRTVASIWRYEYQNANAQEIARQSGAMYDKFVGFVDGMDKLGRQLDGARDVWQETMRRLSGGRGNLVASAEKLRLLGIKSSKRLPGHLLGHDGRDDESDGAE